MRSKVQVLFNIFLFLPSSVTLDLSFYGSPMREGRGAARPSLDPRKGVAPLTAIPPAAFNKHCESQSGIAVYSSGISMPFISASRRSWA